MMADAFTVEAVGTITTAARNKHTTNPIHLFILIIVFIIFLLCLRLAK
jgi:hypothetical protein